MRKRFPVENFRHFWMLLIWALFIGLYVFVEFLPVEQYWVSQIPLDDSIPFCKYFVLPYCTWHILMAVTTAYLAFFDADNFRRFMTFIALGMIPVVIFNLFFPTCVRLRPTTVEGRGLCEWMLRLVYTLDDCTDVLPSMHVIGCFALSAAYLNTPSLRKRHLHIPMLILAVLISLSTVFIKQHSILDVFTAIPYAVLIWWLVYGVIFKKR